MDSSNQFPYFLRGYGNLQNHFAEQFEESDSNQKGDKFADFVEQLVLKTDFGRSFNSVERQQKSHDGGVDFIAYRADGSELWVQSKLRVKGKEELDGIISKFQNRYKQRNERLHPHQPSLFPQEEDSTNDTKEILFQIITLHDLHNIQREYLKTNLSSVSFYNELNNKNQIDIFDGPRILRYLQEAYLKSFVLPEEFPVNFVTECLNWDNVYIGVIAGSELRRLYNEFGDSIFFENIRDYIYYSKDNKTSDVNEEIIETVKASPEKMLSRNNGVVFKASRVEKVSPAMLKLYDASIVNGCQTTMSVVRALNNSECYVAAKIVVTPQGWDVARTANRQNEVGKLELQIAEFLRPQRIKKVALSKGVAIEETQSAITVLNSIYRKSIIYDDMRALFLGLFSRSPNNIFEAGQEAVLSGVLERFYENDPEGENLFESLFTIQLAANDCIALLAEVATQSELTSEIYKRFFKDNIFAYRAYLTLLASCSVSEIDISTASRDDDRYTIRRAFLEKTIAIIEGEPKTFETFVQEAFRTIVMSAPKDIDEDKIKQYLWNHMKKQKFSRLMQDTIMSANLTKKGLAN